MPRTKSFTLMKYFFRFHAKPAFVLLHSHATYFFLVLFRFHPTSSCSSPLSTLMVAAHHRAHQVIILCLTLYPLFLTCSHSLSLFSVAGVYGYDVDDELQWLIESKKFF
ncbi:hypothetical protein S83_012678 [Arachis hypogaea]